MTMEQNVDYELESAFVNFGKLFSKGAMVLEGTIKSVDETNYTCVVDLINSDPNPEKRVSVYNVPLKVLKKVKSSVIEIPTISTEEELNYCLLCYRYNNILTPQLIMVDKIDKVIYDINGKTLEITEDGFVFNGGENGGMVLINKLLERINNIENKLKEHQHAYVTYPGGIVGPLQATTGGETAIPPDYTLQFQNTVIGDLENPDILQ
jgi:hypothetical protein